MSKIAGKFRTTKEKTYGVLMLAFGALFWLLIVWGIWAGLTSNVPQVVRVAQLYLTYGIVFGAIYWLASAFYCATAFGNMILLGPQQFPELHAMVLEGAKALEMSAPPKAFLFNSNGLFNAFARRLLGGRYLFLTSALVEADSDEQVRFVIGHELGHHAAGHLNPWMNLIKAPAYVIPFLQPAYSRAREYTCDSIGNHLSKDLVAARSSLQMLGCGCRRLNEKMNCEAFLAQEAMVPPFFGFLNEIIRSHPRLTRRVAALKDRKAI